MNDFVSTRWVRVIALTASVMVLWAIFIPQGFPWKGFLWMSLAFSAAFWLGRRSSPSVAQVLDTIEAERVPVAPTSVAAAVPKPVL